jgi:hypothetical protein
MANLLGEYWATDPAAPAGDKTGSSLANSAGIDPNAADDIWSIINNVGDAVAEPTYINLCADSAVTIGATINCNQDGTDDWPIFVRGRNAADTANAQVILDGGGTLADAIWTLTKCDYWNWFRITSRATDEAAGHDGWFGTLDADQCHWIDCTANNCYRGFGLHSGQTYCTLQRCYSHTNANYGFLGSFSTIHYDCISKGNASHGFYYGQICNCIANNNGGDGFTYVLGVDGGVAYDNGAYGIQPFNAFPIIVRNFIATENDSYGIRADTTWVTTFNYAHYNNASGAFVGTNKIESGTLALTANPFVDPVNGDFRLNRVAGGGLDVQQIATLSADGLFTSYPDLGVSQSGKIYRRGMLDRARTLSA